MRQGISQHEVRVSIGFKQAVTDRARDEGISVSALLRRSLEAYAAGAPNATTAIESSRTGLHTYVEDEVWDKAVTRAASEGMPVSEAVRIQIESLLVK
jgi:hypothetical protein